MSNATEKVVTYFVFIIRIKNMTQLLLCSTFSKVPRSKSMKDLAEEAKKYINHHIFRGIILKPDEILSAFHRIQLKYQETLEANRALTWIENQKKIYHCFILVYCYLHSKKISEISHIEWDQFSQLFNNKSLLLLHYEAKIIQKSCERVKWTMDQEELLHQCIRYIFKNSRHERTLKWTEISKYIFMKSQGLFFKTPKQCRQHWNNHLNNDICRSGWSVKEDVLILDFVADKGRKWAKLAPLLEGKRTEHMIKNRYHSMMTCANKILKCQQQEPRSESELRKFFKKMLLRKNDSQSSSEQVVANITGVKKEVTEEYDPNISRSQLSQNEQSEEFERQSIKIEAREELGIRMVGKKQGKNSRMHSQQVERKNLEENRETVHNNMNMNELYPMVNYGMPGYMPLQWSIPNSMPMPTNYQNMYYFPENGSNYPPNYFQL